MNLGTRNIPRWIILITDSLVVAFSIISAFFLRFNFDIPYYEWKSIESILPFVLTVRILSFFLTKTYAGIIRYTSSKDIQRIAANLFTGSIVFALFNLVTFKTSDVFFIPFGIIIIEFLISLFVMSSFRLITKAAYSEIISPTGKKRNVIIFGAGEAGLISKRTIDRDAGTRYKVIAFIDDSKNKIGKKIEGISIHSTDNLEKILNKNDVHHIILSSKTIAPARKKEIIEIAISRDVSVLDVPPPENWIKGELSFKQIRSIKIEDLLERDPIKLSENLISLDLKSKTILVTGAAGSIGSELCRQIAKYSPKKMILLDQAESPLHELQLLMKDDFTDLNFEVVVANVADLIRMKKVFDVFSPNYVFHAAAYKHVPMMEQNPKEAVRVNVLGSKVLADLSVYFQIEKFIMVSTDKAVNPTNVMGASKRIAEIYVQALSSLHTTKFITTRFGNVLGSNGSVIPRFKKQIEEGGPLTVTHPEITRFFMTIPEASQLILEASSTGKSGEIYVFDMGKSVKIVDLAKKMIKLSRLTLGKDIEIEYTGLRPGEKLFEELLANEENTIPTNHPKILKGKTKVGNNKQAIEQINNLVEELYSLDNMTTVRKMKDIVPEFVSKNSEFESLDKK